MNLAIDSQIGHATRFQPIDAALKEARASAPRAEQMSLETLATVVSAVLAASVQAPNDAGKGKTAPTVELRSAALSDQDAQATLAGVIVALPKLLAALAASIDPIQTEAGADTRAAESVAVQLQSQPKALNEGPTAAATEAPATGADADIGDRSANAGVWIKSSPFSHLLALLRQILLKFEKLDRDNSAQMITMQREIVILAGEKGEEKSRELLGGAIGAALLTGAIGGAALRQTVKSTSMQTNSLKNNQNAMNNTDVSVASGRGAVKANNTPSTEMRSARDLNDQSAASSGPNQRPSADLQADTDANKRVMDRIGVNAEDVAEHADLSTGHSTVMAKAQIPASNAMMLNMLAPGIGGTVSAGVGIEAEMTESERQLALQVADVFRRIADEQQDHSNKTRDLRDATARLLESLVELAGSTSGHIIGKY